MLEVPGSNPSVGSFSFSFQLGQGQGIITYCTYMSEDLFPELAFFTRLLHV